ncbi:MAG TPA: putative metal-binding motif-containing protein [Candidatus Polarisedimenticolaceae bacterium]|nr:putative metal-binding motif-containing protein [Candidatus Polarisedimenticolaceae bacterium]
MIKGLRLGLGASVMLGLLAAAHATEPLSLVTNHGNVLAYTDGAVPGMPLFTTFGSRMDNPMLADDGTVLFFSNLAGPQITGANSRALFQGTTANDLFTAAQWSDPAPGLPGLSLVNSGGTSGILSGSVGFSPDDRTLFASWLTNASNNLPATSDTALFGGFAGSLGLVAREGDLAPGTAGALFGDFSGLTTQFTGINRNGRVMFPATLVGGDVVGTTNDFALYTGTPGALTIVVRKGDTVLPGPVTAAGFSLYGNTFFGNNQMAGDRILYNLVLSGAGVTTANDESLWFYTPGSGNTLLLREGDPAPGTAGAVFADSSGISSFSLAATAVAGNGRFTFYTGLAGGDTSATNDSAVYIADTTGAATLLARTGAPAPGTDATFKNFNVFQTFVTSSGVGIFTGALTGGTVNATNADGIWAGTPGSVSLVARSGVTQVPGAPSGSTCQQFVSLPIVFSDYGFVVQCNLVGPNVFPGHDSKALVAWTPTKGLFLVWRQGQNLQVSPGVFRPQIFAGSLQMSNTEGRALGLSHTGTLAMTVGLDPGISVATVDLNCFPTTDYYFDADGDGYGDPTTELNLCAGQFPPPGYITRAGDCLDSDPTKTGATTEICNGIDDDCNGRIDDGVPHPTGPLALTMSRSAGNVTMSWNAVPNAIQYDVISGDLGELRGAGGYQFLTQAQCAGNDVSGTSMTLPGSPAVGNGQFFVMRAVGCTGLGSYDEGVPSQHSTRDQGIGSSLYACP